MIVTQRQILFGLEQRPCTAYPVARIAKIFGGRSQMPILEALRLPLPSEDILRAALTYPGILPDHCLHELTCRYAEYALGNVNDPDPRSVAAITAKRAWLRGEITDEELEAVAEAVRAGAWEEVRTGAWEAAWGAAQAATWETAAEAAWEAARKTAWESAQDAACGAEGTAEAAIWDDLLQITRDYLAEVPHGS